FAGSSATWARPQRVWRSVWHWSNTRLVEASSPVRFLSRLSGRAWSWGGVSCASGVILTRPQREYRRQAPTEQRQQWALLHYRWISQTRHFFVHHWQGKGDRATVLIRSWSAARVTERRHFLLHFYPLP